MQKGSRCNEDQDAIRVKTQRGSKCNEGQNATRINMQQGSRCNEDQDAKRIFNAPFIPFSIALGSRRPNSRTCVLVLLKKSSEINFRICRVLKKF